MKLSPHISGPILVTVLIGCSDASDPMLQYGAMQQALGAQDAISPVIEAEASTEHCSAQFEPQLVLLDIGLHDDEVVLTVSNTTEEDVTGTVDVYAMSSRERRATAVPFGVGGLGDNTLRVPLATLGVDDEIDLAIISGKVSGTFADGQDTYAVGEFVYDIRQTKPELLEETDDESRLERVTVAMVSNGVEAERLAAARADDSDEIIEEVANGGATTAGAPRRFQPFAVTKTICFDANLILLTAGIGEDFWNSTNTTVWARGQRIDAKPPGGASYSTWWLDNNGCITINVATGTWDFKAYPVTRLLKGGAVWTNIFNKRWPDDVYLTNSFTANVTASDQTIAYSAGTTMHISHLAHEAFRNRINDLTYRSFPASINIINTYNTPPVGGSKYDPATEVIYIQSGHQQDKFVTVHEVGHYIQYNEAEETSWGYNDTRSGVSCTTPSAGHFTNSREFNSAAGVEGFGHYWDALICVAAHAA